MGLKELMGGISLTILFIISMIYFMTAFIQTNNPEGFGSDIAYINSTTLPNLTAQAQELQNRVDSARETLETKKPSAVYLFLIIESAFLIPISFIAFLISGTVMIVGILFTTFFGVGSGNFSIIVGIITGLLMLGIVFAVLKAIRTGQTER